MSGEHRAVTVRVPSGLPAGLLFQERKGSAAAAVTVPWSSTETT
jgi:hypothetical protein